jgi:hypothetical protein
MVKFRTDFFWQKDDLILKSNVMVRGLCKLTIVQDYMNEKTSPNRINGWLKNWIEKYRSTKFE